MSKNIVIFVMSPFRDDAKSIEFTGASGFKAVCRQTNETAVRYIDYRLRQEGQHIDAVYIFVSDEAKKGLPALKEVFTSSGLDFGEQTYHEVSLYNDGNMQGAFKSICEMFTDLQKYIDDNTGEEITAHIDTTGGPRHASMLMMVLIQMLKHSHVQTGFVTYTNILRQKNAEGQGIGTVEDAAELMEMFTLIGGADEFTSFGSVDQIKHYFAKKENLSDELNSLLNQMERFSETMKICAEYKYINQALAFLQASVEKYEKFLRSQKGKNISEQEKFFSKLLQNIKNEYAAIMPSKNADSDKLEIIKWCVKRGFLQQALTFYTEWLPNYVLETGLISVRDDEIPKIKDSDKNNNWIKCLFRSYTPAGYKDSAANGDLSLNEKLTRTDLLKVSEKAQKLAQNGASYDSIITELKAVQQRIKGRNEGFEDFIAKLIALDPSENNFVRNISKLPNDNPLKFIMKDDCPPTAVSLENFLKKRIRTLKIPQAVILKSLPFVRKEKFSEFFGLTSTVKNAANTSEEISDKALRRQKVLDFCRKNNILTTTLKKEKFLDFVRTYNECVGERRNKMNHASESIASKESNIDIGKMITDSVSLLEKNK